MNIIALRQDGSIPTPGTPEFRAWAAATGQELAGRGTGALDRTLVALARLAQRRGIAAVSRSVLADRREPEVARARAFARVVTMLIEVAPAPEAPDVAA